MNNLKILLLFILNILLAVWSLGKLNSYASQDKIGSIAFALVFGISLFLLQKIILEWKIKEKSK